MCEALAVRADVCAAIRIQFFKNAATLFLKSKKAATFFRRTQETKYFQEKENNGILKKSAIRAETFSSLRTFHCEGTNLVHMPKLVSR